MALNDELTELANALGRSLRESPEAHAYHEARQAAQDDDHAARLIARLDEMYDDLIQRQSAGEVLSAGEINAYYDLEQEVQQHPALANQARALERVKDLFTETHSLLTNELGLNLQDLIK
jgi:cell fate (sporulation/competence/biofilm development) regulator YlbF (YheA/YmcA/DUF963 family)